MTSPAHGSRPNGQKEESTVRFRKGAPAQGNNSNPLKRLGSQVGAESRQLGPRALSLPPGRPITPLCVYSRISRCSGKGACCPLSSPRLAVACAEKESARTS
jgi:hypothetical protein